MKKTMVVWLGATVCCFLWGSAYPCIKLGYNMWSIGNDDPSSQILFAGIRFTFAGVLAIAIGSAACGHFIRPERAAAGKIIGLSFLQTIIQYFFFYIGLAKTSGVKASIIDSMNVFIAILVSALMFRQEKINARKIAGCLIGFAGVVLINLNGMNFHMTLGGEGAIFLSTIAYAFSSVFIKKYSGRHNPIMLSGYQFIFGGLVLAAAGFLTGGRMGKVTGSGVLMLFYLAFISAVAYSLWGILLKYNSVSRVTVFGLMNPVFGVILSAIFLNEGGRELGVMSLVSLLLVCAGIYAVNSEGMDYSNLMAETERTYETPFVCFEVEDTEASE